MNKNCIHFQSNRNSTFVILLKLLESVMDQLKALFYNDMYHDMQD